MNAHSQEQQRALREQYRSRGIVLAIGSGVSAGSQVPTWPALLKGLARQLYKAEGDEVYAKLTEAGYTLPAIAGMLEHRSYDRGITPEVFTEWLRKEIYGKFPFFKSGVRGDDRDKFLRHVREHNTTLRAVAALCVRPGAAGSYVRNPRVAAIVNFNFDALLQAYVQARYGAKGHRLLRTIERPSAGAVPTRIPVYHLHGYLVFDERKFRRRDVESPDLRVFTEQEYFESFNQPTRMGSYAFLHLLREHSVLFIGLSLRDDNIRRLLHYSLSEREAGYVAEGRTMEYARSRGLRHFALLPESPSSESNALTVLSLQRLGTSIIWYRDHREIPMLLRDMYGGDWDAVY